MACLERLLHGHSRLKSPSVTSLIHLASRREWSPDLPPLPTRHLCLNQAINKSLSVLANVFSALYRKDNHVPYRESVLTNLLRHSLGGDSKALMVCNLSPSTSHLHESICSLRFATKVNACVTGNNANKGPTTAQGHAGASGAMVN